MANMAYVDGGGSGPIGAPRDQPQTHTVATGETLREIADRYGVQPQAIRDANPQIFRSGDADRRHNAMETGETIWSGDQLNIPAAPQSVTNEQPLNSDFNPAYPSPNSEYTVNGQGQNNGGAITWNPGDGTVKVTASHQQSAEYDTTPAPFGIPDARQPGVTLEAKVRGEHAETAGFTNKDGNTEVTLEWDTSIVASVSAEAQGKGVNQAAIEASAGGGFRARYKVVLPGENRNPLDAAKINPFDPTTIPVGVTVTMDSQTYTQTGLAGSFRHIGTETNIKDASGTSYSVTRVDDNNIRVIMGPNNVVEAYNGVGVKTDIATAMLGRQDNLGQSTVRTATFDLSNKDGQAAYSHFVATGEVAHQTPGVKDVATIERIDYSSQTRVKLGLGPESLNVQADLAGAQNTGAFVKTTYPDGSYAYTTNLQYSGNVPLQVVQRFDTQGNEILSERTYQFTINGDRPSYGWLDRFFGANEGAEERNIAQNLNIALTGNPDGNGPAQAGKKTTITFTESQLQGLMSQTRSAGEASHPSNPLNLLVGGNNGQPVATSMEFAVAMARNLGGDPYGFSQRLAEVSQMADGDVRNGWQRIDADAKSS